MQIQHVRTMSPTSGETRPPRSVQPTERTDTGYNLQRDYIEANPVTILRLEKNRMYLLVESLSFKRENS